MTTTQATIEPEFHPKFNDPTAGTILSSKDGTLYRIHRTILRSASGFLEPFLLDANGAKGVPGSSSGSTIPVGDAEIISLPFSDGPLERVFLMMTLKEVPSIRSIQELEEVVDVMEYLDTRGLLSHMRAFCFAPVLQSEPIRLYCIGAKFGWEDVMQYAAEYPLHLNLFPSDNAETTEMENQLARLDSRSYHRLLKLHRHRRDEFHTFLKANLQDQKTNLRSQQKHSLCPYCHYGVSSQDTDGLIYRLVWEIDQNSTGETILSSSNSWNIPSTQCSNCRREVTSQKDVMDTVKRGIAGLPRDLR